MEFCVRWTLGAEYAEVTVSDNNTEVRTGLLDNGEASAMAAHLREIAEELDGKEFVPKGASDADV